MKISEALSFDLNAARSTPLLLAHAFSSCGSWSTQVYLPAGTASILYAETLCHAVLSPDTPGALYLGRTALFKSSLSSDWEDWVGSVSSFFDEMSLDISAGGRAFTEKLGESLGLGLFSRSTLTQQTVYQCDCILMPVSVRCLMKRNQVLSEVIRQEIAFVLDDRGRMFIDQKQALASKLALPR